MPPTTEESRKGQQSESQESDVIDVVDQDENEEDDVFPFDRRFFIKKLREKPKFPPEPDECGTSWPKKSYKGFSVPVADRLSVPMETSIDLIRARIPYPKGVIPPLALPSWHFMALEKKIPMLQSPKDLFYYTRGRLGEKLHRRTSAFSVRDPYNRERVITDPYTTLHDPNVKEFLFNPPMRSLLLERGFINNYNEVMCTLAEFNRFRDYLRTLYCDKIWRDIEASDALFKVEREQLRMLIRHASQNDATGREAIVAARIDAARKFQESQIEFKRQMQHQKDQMSEARLRQWQNEKDRKILEQVLEGVEQAKRNKEKLQALYEFRLQQQREMLTKSVRKFIETQERQQNDKALMQAAYNKFLLEWIESKYVFCYEKLVQKRQIQQDLRGNMKYLARKRQLRLESYREQMPAMLEKRKAEEERIWVIVRKYGMRWLGRVRARLNAPKDVEHESCWIGHSKNALEETVKYLRQESGYEKLDDFILNIMKLKKQIQAQIELEEAMEAEQAQLAEGERNSPNDEAAAEGEGDTEAMEDE